MVDKISPRRLLNIRGVSLTELMIAVAILSISVLAFVGAFKYITQSFSYTRGRTLATNLAQEKIETLKDLPYYALLLSNGAAFATCGANTINYDNANYPPESIAIGGINFTRYTWVTMATLTNNIITQQSNSYPDTGLKKLTSTVTWFENGACKMWSLSNLLENPNVNPLDSTISGTVTKVTGGGALASAVVYVQENTNWTTLTDNSGNYSFRVSHGSYTVHVSSYGYYPNTSGTLTAPQGGSVSPPYSPALASIASGTVSGNVWINKGLLISGIMSSSFTAVTDSTYNTANPCGTHRAQTIELFNTTTAQINILSGAAGNGPWTPGGGVTENFKINVTCPTGTCDNSGIAGDLLGCTNNNRCVYVSSYVAAGGYFLISNQPEFYMQKTSLPLQSKWVKSDAYYQKGPCTFSEIVPRLSCGSVQLNDSFGNTFDQVCWDGYNCTPANYATLTCNGTMVPLNNNSLSLVGCGMNTGGGTACSDDTPGDYIGNQLIRFSSPTYVGRGVYGSAYNSGNNSYDFTYPATTQAGTLGPLYFPLTTSDPVLKVISGIPAFGALVSVSSDPFSTSTKSLSQSVIGNINGVSYTHSFSPFLLTSVATGTWEVDFASGSYYTGIANVIVTQGQNVAIPNTLNPTTPPAVDGNNIPSVNLTSTTIGGFLQGQVVDANGIALNTIAITAGGMSKVTNAFGTYSGLIPSSGTVGIFVNSPTASAYKPNYQSITDVVTITSGSITTYNVTLLQAGTVTGYATSGTTPLPNVVIAAISGAGSQAGSAVTDTTGAFTMIIATSTYNIQPVLVPGQSYTSSNGVNQPVSATVNIGVTVNVGTFTVAGALGSISGNVTYNSQSVTSGVLIVASTGTIGTTPPAICGSSAAAQTPIYAVSSKADGTYSLPVRGGYTYNIMAYYPLINGAIVTPKTVSYSGIIVTGSNNTTQNVTIPYP